MENGQFQDNLGNLITFRNSNLYAMNLATIRLTSSVFISPLMLF
jgi:hypothetical protein